MNDFKGAFLKTLGVLAAVAVLPAAFFAGSAAWRGLLHALSSPAWHTYNDCWTAQMKLFADEGDAMIDHALHGGPAVEKDPLGFDTTARMKRECGERPPRYIWEGR